jgi:hypothetical protein
LAAAGTGRARGTEEERGNRTAGRREVTYDGRALILDGARRMLFSGDMHYPRSTPEVLVKSLLLLPGSRIMLMRVSMPFLHCFNFWIPLRQRLDPCEVDHVAYRFRSLNFEVEL